MDTYIHTYFYILYTHLYVYVYIFVHINIKMYTHIHKYACIYGNTDSIFSCNRIQFASFFCPKRIAYDSCIKEYMRQL